MNEFAWRTGQLRTAVRAASPHAALSLAGNRIWAVRDAEDEVLGIGGPDPARAWEAAASYLGIAA